MNEHLHCPVGSPGVLPDYETLSRLAAESPVAFEDLRQQLIEGLISRAPGRLQARLRGIQFRVDGIRRLTRSSLGATVKIYGLMWNSFLEMDQQLRDFVVLTRTNAYRPLGGRAEGSPHHSAKVIQFRPPQRGSTSVVERVR